MRASTERKLISWFHILASIPILGFIYGPVASISEAAFMTRAVILPAVVLSGLWLWLGHYVRRWNRAASTLRATS
ncbi:hypothetical protein BN8_00039 [Fibrisoma limi BUZ 3]|uniref:DUF2306 domain-containing protein n=1 Tax=Fibrisoma limi BUZ 3 TaxID=1185876 RepID=I2GB57_9BACT|nr:hypothetical protein [Fibrisoma limi]CCH51129.1 hypothetical protein BN8_00039 [Fibrisoma limi BUZ 3]